MTRPDWIAVDWGSSHLRVWAMDAGGAALARAASDRGTGGLGVAEFEPALLSLIAPWLEKARVPVLVCGMAGAREGWAQAGYRSVPCAPVAAGGMTAPMVRDPRLDVAIIPGLSQSAPADVMRGEETQIAGLLRARPDFSGALCLPGTHSKWAALGGGGVTGFQTFMTGEMFELLAARSVLRHTAESGWHDDAFAGAVRDALDDPAAMPAQLFGLRAGALLHGLAPGAARARLSGLLIGAELSAARAFWSAGPVHLVGAGPLARAYAAALAVAGCTAIIEDAEALTLSGLHLARDLMMETPT
jgi:2-dehydro-3-deoxygalactonokinase